MEYISLFFYLCGFVLSVEYTKTMCKHTGEPFQLFPAAIVSTAWPVIVVVGLINITLKRKVKK